MKSTLPTLSLSPKDAARAIKRIEACAVDYETGCFVAPVVGYHGYGKFGFTVDGTRRMTGLHRAAWLAIRGPIEDASLVLDHLCRNRACCNPDHLELVSNIENIRRGDHSGKKGRSGVIAGQPFGCGKHGMVDGHWYTQPDGYTRWACRICQRERTAATATRRRGGKPPRKYVRKSAA